MNRYSLKAFKQYSDPDDLIFFWEFSRRHKKRKPTATLSNPIFVLWFRLKVVDWYSTYLSIVADTSVFIKRITFCLNATFTVYGSIQQFVKSFNSFNIRIFENPNSTNGMYYTLMCTENTVHTAHNTQQRNKK